MATFSWEVYYISITAIDSKSPGPVPLADLGDVAGRLEKINQDNRLLHPRLLLRPQYRYHAVLHLGQLVKGCVANWDELPGLLQGLALFLWR